MKMKMAIVLLNSFIKKKYYAQIYNENENENGNSFIKERNVYKYIMKMKMRKWQ